MTLGPIDRCTVMKLRRTIAVAGVVATTALLLPVTAAASPALTLGFSSDPVLETGPAAAQSFWLGRAAREGAQMIRVDVPWSRVAPGTRPTAFNPQDPSSPGYDWAATDAAVRNVSGHGLSVLLMLFDAPSWAEGPNRPRNVNPGTWEPSASQFAAFATAAAKRYSGTYPDPLHPGQFLPRVQFWQAWNEENLDYYLSPQWRRAGAGWAPAGPAMYRGLINGLYGAVKSVHSSNYVVMGGTAPYGDPPGATRMRPLTFDRYLFCLTRALRKVRCAQPVHLDAVDHHPYETAPPTQSAFWSDDVAVPNVHKIRRVLDAAVRAGTVLPHGPKGLWVTELAWDSNPPSTSGTAVSLSTQARYLELSDYLLYKQGVSTVLWLAIHDSAPAPGFKIPFQWSGLFFFGGAAKPSATAFYFPFVAQRDRHGELSAWSRAPVAGTLVISQQLSSGAWQPVASMPVAAGQVITTQLPVTGDVPLEASIGQLASLPWAQSS